MMLSLFTIVCSALCLWPTTVLAFPILGATSIGKSGSLRPHILVSRNLELISLHERADLLDTGASDSGPTGSSSSQSGLLGSSSSAESASGGTSSTSTSSCSKLSSFVVFSNHAANTPFSSSRWLHIQRLRSVRGRLQQQHCHELIDIIFTMRLWKVDFGRWLVY
jgi:hypothetical protein